MAGTWTQGAREAFDAMKSLGFKRGEFSAKQEYTKYGEYAGVRISYKMRTKDFMARVNNNPTKFLDAGLSVCLFFDADVQQIRHASVSLSSYNRGGVGKVEVLRVAAGQRDELVTWMVKRDGFLSEVTPKADAFGWTGGVKLNPNV